MRGNPFIQVGELSARRTSVLEDLLAAVVEAVERAERTELDRLLTMTDDPWQAGETFWKHVADTAQAFAPLIFEPSAAALRGEPWAASLRTWLGTGWTEAFTRACADVGVPTDLAENLARLGVATARGVILELCANGERPAGDAAMARFAEMVRSVLP